MHALDIALYRSTDIFTCRNPPIPKYSVYEPISDAVIKNATDPFRLAMPNNEPSLEANVLHAVSLLDK